MKLPRRRFLSLLGATPIAAKVAADEVIAKQAGIKLTGLGADKDFVSRPLGFGNMPADIAPKIPYEQQLARAMTHVDLFGLPGCIEEDLRNQADYVDALDPDLAALRSWSMAVKIQTQRERNYVRRVAALRQSARLTRERSLLRKLLGFDWPW